MTQYIFAQTHRTSLDYVEDNLNQYRREPTHHSLKLHSIDSIFSSPEVATCPANLILHNFIDLIIFCKSTNYELPRHVIFPSSCYFCLKSKWLSFSKFFTNAEMPCHRPAETTLSKLSSFLDNQTRHVKILNGSKHSIKCICSLFRHKYNFHSLL
jgi:hypothetical protein